MKTAAAVSHPQDIAYISENFSTLGELCREAGIDEAVIRREIAIGERPRASYRLADGREFFPRDYLASYFSRQAFSQRLREAAKDERVTLTDADIDDEWQSYLTGIYGVCLKEVTPENIVRKGALLERIERLLADPQQHNFAWLRELGETVNLLDALERPFSPYFDRVVFGRPPTRDSHIRDVRVRFGV